jgi:hypothetical protein
MGCYLRSDAHPSLWSLARALLVPSTQDVLKESDLPLLSVQVLGLGFLVGCTLAPNLKTFAGQQFSEDT